MIARPRARARARAGRTVWLAGLVIAGTIGGACAAPGGDPGTQVAREPSLDDAVLDWGDDLDHVVVYAAPPEAGTGAAAADPAAEPRTGPARDGHTSLPPDDQTYLLAALDGSTRQVTVPEGSLVAVTAATVHEADVLAEVRATSPVALIVADPRGVVGRPGGRYVLDVDHLRELPPPDDPAEPHVTDPTSPSGESGASEQAGAPTAPDATDPTGPQWQPPSPGSWTAEATSTLLFDLRSVVGVVSAEPVAPGVVAVATAGDREDLAAVAGVTSVADDVLLDYAVDERQVEQWALENTGSGGQAGGWPGVAGADTRATRGWAVSEGAGVVVAVVDSGVDLDHEDLTTRLWTNTDEVCANAVDDDANGKVDDCAGWDFGAGDANPRPDALVPASDHGTHVAGIVAAGRNGIGVVGVAPAATVMPLKVANASGAISTSAVYAAMVYAVDQGADVINLSLATRTGTARSSVTALENGVTYARSHGVLVVAGAGNDGVDITNRTRAVWPAGFSLLFDNVVTAGATTNADTRAGFSNFGDPITVWAPGWWMLSTVPGGYGWKSGTSMAAPMVSGAAAAVIASGLATTPSAVRDRLVSTAEVLDVGYRLDVAAAVGIPPEADIDVTYTGVDGLQPDQPAELTIHVAARSLPAAAAHLRFSLAAAVDYEVRAVGGLAAALTAMGGTTAVVRTDDAGTFPLVPIANPAALAGGGWDLDVAVALPVGDYALVTEVLDGTGSAMGGMQVAYVTVGAGLPVTSTTLTATSLAPTSTAAGVTTTAGGPGTTVTVPDGGTGTTTTAPDDGTGTPTTVDGGGTTTSTTAGATTTTGAGTTTTIAGAPTTSVVGTTTTVPTATTAPSTSTSTTAVATTTTEPASTTSIGTTTTVSGPTTTAAVSVTTTPTPDGDTDGAYRIDEMKPRYATLDGTTVLLLTGTFPPTIPVYVWFGDKGIVEAQSSDGSTILLTSPEVLTEGVTDVSVRFTLDRAYRLTLSNAFTFGTAPSGGATTTTSPGATTTVAAPSSTATSTSTTVAGATTTTSTPGGATTTTGPGAATTTTAAGGPTTTAASSTTGGGPTTTIPLTSELTLQPRPATGPLASLTTADWPRPGCRSATCDATPRAAG